MKARKIWRWETSDCSPSTEIVARDLRLIPCGALDEAMCSNPVATHVPKQPRPVPRPQTSERDRYEAESAAMSERAGTDRSLVATGFDNFLLKRWLHRVGSIRRCKLLQKLKTDLQNRGLSRKQVRRGLLQLATRPRVLLTKLSSTRRRHRSIKSSTKEDEKPREISNSCTAEPTCLVRCSRSIYEDTDEPQATETSTEGNSERSENAGGIKACKTELVNSSQELPVTNRNCKLEYRTSEALCSFDKAMEQLDKIISFKANVPEKSVSKGTTVIVPADTTVNSEDQSCVSDKNTFLKRKSTYSMHQNGKERITRVKGQSKCTARDMPDLIDTEDDDDFNHIPAQTKNDHLKLNLNSRKHKEAKSTDKKSLNVEVSANENKYHAQQNSKPETDLQNRTVPIITKVVNTEENAHKKRPKRKRICSSIDELKQTNRQKRKKLKNRFRIFFGDCISISEDEQEVNILRSRFKKRRKLDSIDSCDSGVYSIEENGDSNSVKVSKGIQKAVPDSTVQEEITGGIPKKISVEANLVDDLQNVCSNESIKTDHQIERIPSVIEADTDKSETSLQTEVEDVIQEESNICDPGVVDSSQTEREHVTQEEVTNNCDKNNLMQPVVTHDAETSQGIENSEVNTAETIHADTVSCDISDTCDRNRDVPLTITREFSEYQESTINTKDLNELLQMNFNETCDIKSNGNVLSIQENTEKHKRQEIIIDDIDENSNLIILPEIQPNCNKNVSDKEKMLDGTDNNDHSKDVVITLNTTESSDFFMKEGAQAPLTDNRSNMLNNTNLVLQESELNLVTEKQDIQSNKVFQGKLRVLSSAELGSRWCPTPVHSLASTVPQFSCTNTITISDVPAMTVPIYASASVAETVSVTLPVTSTTKSVSPSVSTKTPANTTRKSNMSKRISTSVHAALVAISESIKSIRTSTPTSDFDQLLFTQFETLRKLVSTNVVDVIRILNKELFLSQPLTVLELFYYSPTLKSYTIPATYECIRLSQNNFTEHRYVTTVTSSTTSTQNTYKNSEATQNVSTTSVHNASPHLVSILTMQNQHTSNLNKKYAKIYPKDSQQNGQEKLASQSQSNLFQSNTSINSSANYGTPQQAKHRIQTQHATLQHTPQTYFVRPITNDHAPQSFSFAPVTSLNPSQTGKRIAVSMVNAPPINQQYVSQNTYAAQGNLFYNANTNTMPVPNHLVQQSISSAHAKNIPNVPTPSAHQYFQYPMHRQNPHASQRASKLLQNASQLPPNLQQNLPQFSQNVQKSVPQVSQNIPQNTPQLSQNIQHGVPQFSQHFQQNPPQLSQNIQQNMPQLSQNMQHVPVISHVPQTLRRIFAANGPQNATRNTQQNEQICQQVPAQAQTKVPPMFTSEQTTFPQHTQNNHSSKTTQQPTKSTKNKEDTAQVSLESTVHQFNVLKHLSAIQNIVLVKQMNFYFGCTTWLQQQFTSEQWQIVHSERSLLLHFQTLLRHLVEKVVKNLLRSRYEKRTYEKNILQDIRMDVPQKVQIIVQENHEVHCENDVSMAEQDQHGTLNAHLCNMPRQENLDVIIIPNEPDKDEDVTGNSTNKHFSEQRLELEVLQEEEEIQTNKQDKQTTLHGNCSAHISISETPKLSGILQEEEQKKKQDEQVTVDHDQPTVISVTTTKSSDSNGNDKDVVENEVEYSSKLCMEDAKKDNLGQSEKAGVNSYIASQKALITSDLKDSDKDTVQHLNSHLVTVEISPNDDQVKVIDTIPEGRDDTNITIKEMLEKSEQRLQEKNHFSTDSLSSLLLVDIVQEMSDVTSDISEHKIENSNNVGAAYNTSLEGFIVSNITDVKSVSLEAFEKFGEDVNNNPADNFQENIEEEEIKVCLLCSKPSTVACSVCLEAKYCSKQCSQLHWEEHYKDCKPVTQTVYL